METIASLGFILLIGFLMFMSLMVVTRVVQSESRRKSFTPNMKAGDLVEVPVMDRYIGEVLEVNGDEVKIVVTAPKSKVYPKSK
jgi:hypothetical protein